MTQGLKNMGVNFFLDTSDIVLHIMQCPFNVIRGYWCRCRSNDSL